MTGDKEPRQPGAPLLLIGPMAHRSGQAGGTTVSFELLCTALETGGYKVIAVDSNLANYKTRVSGLIKIGLRVARLLRHVTHVSLHGSTRDFLYLAPILVFVCRRLRVNVSLRKFAGNFDEVVDGLEPMRRLLVRYALTRAKACFFETHYLVTRFKPWNEATYWLPNYREVEDMPARHRSERPCVRFMFLGQLRTEKGIDEILAASLGLNTSCSVDLYGPIVDPRYEVLLRANYPLVRYRGRLPAEQVPDVLAAHDTLLLPSYREGYPGVIIEAFAAGVPVIASRLRGIEEMMTDGVEGILVEPRNASELLRAMRNIGGQTHERMSAAARHRAGTFEVKSVVREFALRAGIS